MRSNTIAIHRFLCAITLLLVPCLFAAKKITPAALALGKQLSPAAPARSYKPESLAPLSAKMIKVLEILQKSYQSNGPGPDSILATALGSREDVGSWEELMLSRALLDAWKKADYMNLFDKNGDFTATSAHGSKSGEKILFELIVPGEVYPPASNQLANLRLISVSEKRTPDSPLTPREQATHQQLIKMVDAYSDRKAAAKLKGPKTDSMGLTKADSDKAWEKARAEAGDQANARPNIIINPKLEATPSHMTQNRWRLGCEFRNLSSFPTEFKAEVWLLGVTDELGEYYIMKHEEIPLKLRSSESRKIEVFTKSERSYKTKADDFDQLTKKERKDSRVRYRGYVIRIIHNKKVISFAGGDSLMTNFADPENTESGFKHLPNF